MANTSGGTNLYLKSNYKPNNFKPQPSRVNPGPKVNNRISFTSDMNYPVPQYEGSTLRKLEPGGRRVYVSIVMSYLGMVITVRIFSQLCS